MKTCIRCEKQKRLRDFYKGETASQGFFHICSDCRPVCFAENKKRASIRQKIQYSKKTEGARSERIVLLATKKAERLRLLEIEKAERLKLLDVKKEQHEEAAPKKLASKPKRNRTAEEKARASLLQGKRSKKKKKKSIVFKMLCNLRNRNYFAFKNMKREKGCVELLGTDLKSAKKYIESLFYHNPVTGECMSWDNYGKGPGKWQIDHKEALGSARTVEKLSLLCHYTNLQPLWSEDHIKKTILDTKKIKLNKINKLNNIHEHKQ